MCATKVEEGRAVLIHAGCSRVHARIDGIELCVIKEIEVFPPELESGSLVNRKALEGTEIEVEAAGQIQRVSPDVTKCESGR